MTPEDIEYLKEVVKTYKEIDLFTGIMVGVFMIGILIYVIWEIYRYKKIKEMHQEYKQTLSEEELEKIKRYNKYK